MIQYIREDVENLDICYECFAILLDPNLSAEWYDAGAVLNIDDMGIKHYVLHGDNVCTVYDFQDEIEETL